MNRHLGCAAVLVLCTTFGSGLAGADDRDLGRVFFSPGERADLDAGRSGEPGQQASNVGTTKPAAAPTPVVVNGVLRHRPGRDVVWINGQTAGADDVVVRRGPDRQNAVTVDAHGARVRLRPGQSFDPATGRVRECGRCGPAAVPAEPVADPAPPPAASPPSAGAAGVTGSAAATAALAAGSR